MQSGHRVDASACWLDISLSLKSVSTSGHKPRKNTVSYETLHENTTEQIPPPSPVVGPLNCPGVPGDRVCVGCDWPRHPDLACGASRRLTR